MSGRRASITNRSESTGATLQVAFTRAAFVAGITAMALGGTGVVAWLLDMPTLQSFGYGFATIKFNTALSLLLGGLALTLTAGSQPTRPHLLVARSCAAIVALTGAMTLVQYVLGRDLGIDQLLMRATRSLDGALPGRMAPTTALCVVLIGSAQLFFDTNGRKARLAAQAASLFVLFIGALALAGYLFSVDALYGVPGYTSMALPTAIAFTVLSAGLLASRPDRGITAILAQPNSAGASIRRLLPFLVLVPLLLAWLQLFGAAAGHFGPEFGAALTATLSVGLLSFFALHNARIHGEWESERMRTDAHIRLAMESAPDGMIIVDSQGKIVLANAEVERLFGYSRAELVGGPVEKLLPEYLRAQHERARANYQSQPVARPMAPTARGLQGSRKDGGVVPVEIGLNPMRTPHGDFVLGTIIDVRHRERLERAAERERFFQLSNDALCITDRTGRFVQVNPAIERILGFTRDEMLTKRFIELIHPDDVQASLHEAEQARAGKSVIDFRNRYRAKDGTYRWLQWRAIPDRGGSIYASARDITQDLEATRALEASVRERGVLLQEVHHRVKNNLQIIASMINIQARKFGLGVACEALEECGSRVRAIGLIHEILYQSKDFAHISFRDYVTALVDNIFRVSEGSSAAISRQLDILPVLLTMKKAIPCGLIVNELVTNALKHAFPGNRRGNVQVRLREQPAGRLILTVADDGVGLGENFEVESTHSMGLMLVTTLVEQLKGRLDITRTPGARFDITFPREAIS